MVKNRLMNKVLKKMGYVRKEVVVNKLKENKRDLISLEEQIFELKCERQNLLMEVEYRRAENKQLAAALEDERIARLASERSLAIAKEVMRHDKAIKKVFGGDK